MKGRIPMNNFVNKVYFEGKYQLKKAGRKVKSCFSAEEGGAEMLAAIILLVVVVLIAVVFKDKLGSLVSELWNSIDGNKGKLTEALPSAT